LGSYAEGEGEDGLAKFGRVEEDLEKTVEVACGPLIFETDGIALLAGQIGHGEVVCAVTGLPIPTRLDLSFFLAGKEVLLRVKHIIKHIKDL
jgi:hypothetical protein